MGKKDKKGRGKGRDSESSGRNRYLKAGYSEEGEHGGRYTSDTPKSRKANGKHAVAKTAKGPSLSVDDLEFADRKRLAKYRAEGCIPKADTVDKNLCYMEAVQLPAAEVHNLLNLYSDLRSESSAPRHRPTTLREDFCGTAILCREWVKGGVEREAYGVDLDPVVIKYAKERTLGLDGGPECERVDARIGNVLSPRSELGVPKVDIIAALNYGVNYFKKRPDLMTYLRNCREGLAPGGTLIVDLFGGATVASAGGRLFERQYSNFKYYFEQKPYDLLTNTSRVHLHFRFDDGSWMKNAWSYDFRAYTIIEIREAMVEAGFRSTHVWLAASTEEKEAQTLEEDDDADSGEEEALDEDEESSDEESGRERFGHHNEKRSSTRTGSGAEGAYSYERVDGEMEQLESWNAYVVGII